MHAARGDGQTMTDKESNSIDGNDKVEKKGYTVKEIKAREDAYDEFCPGCTGHNQKFRIDTGAVYAVVCKKHLVEALEQLCMQYPSVHSFELSRLNFSAEPCP